MKTPDPKNEKVSELVRFIFREGAKLAAMETALEMDAKSSHPQPEAKQ